MPSPSIIAININTILAIVCNSDIVMHYHSGTWSKLMVSICIDSFGRLLCLETLQLSGLKRAVMVCCLGEHTAWSFLGLFNDNTWRPSLQALLLLLFTPLCGYPFDFTYNPITTFAIPWLDSYPDRPTGSCNPICCQPDWYCDMPCDMFWVTRFLYQIAMPIIYSHCLPNELQ